MTTTIIGYKGYEIKTFGRVGNGSFSQPLTNVPWGYEIYKDGERRDGWTRAFGKEESAINFAKEKIDRLEREVAGLDID